MQQIPNIVRERLKAATSAGSHLDANVITAFAEKSLPELERSLVLEHLARCGECRDVLASALPEVEVEAHILPVRTPWLTWPVLRWGLVAAGIVVVIASIGVLQYNRHMPQAAIVAKQMPRSEVAVGSSTQTPPSAAPVAASPAEKQDKTPVTTALFASRAASNAAGAAKKLIARAEPPPAERPRAEPHEAMQSLRPRGRGVGSGFSGVHAAGTHNFGDRMTSQVHQQQIQQQQNQIQASRLVPTPPNEKQQAAGATQTVEVQASSALLEAQSKDVRNQIHSDQYALVRAKPAVTGQAIGAPLTSATANPAPHVQGDAIRTMSFLPRWTISSTGGVQRSFDQGYSWQDVDVNSAGALSPNFTGTETTDATLAKDKSAAAKTIKAQAAPPVFHAVSANGADVWAGGSGGALYHSSDAGNHWTRVVPASGGITVTGDIVAVEFSDSQHGKLTTSTSESWITNDGGQSWRKL